jgi:hypothetical protein
VRKRWISGREGGREAQTHAMVLFQSGKVREDARITGLEQGDDDATRRDHVEEREEIVLNEKRF